MGKYVIGGAVLGVPVFILAVGIALFTLQIFPNQQKTAAILLHCSSLVSDGKIGRNDVSTVEKCLRTRGIRGTVSVVYRTGVVYRTDTVLR